MILLEDEKSVLKWISEYGPLTRTQLLGLLSHKQGRVAEKILRNICRAGYLQTIGNGYYACDSCSRPDRKYAAAVWVLLRFIDKVRPTDHRAAAYPSQIFFMKEAQAYEIVVIPEGEEYVTQLLQPQTDRKYILVVSDISRAPLVKCPASPCLFAVLTEHGSKEPDVMFYSKEDIAHG